MHRGKAMWELRGASQVALVVKNLPASAGDIRDMGLITWVGKIPWEGNGSPLQYSCLENPMDRGAWRATVHGVAKRQTQLKWFSTRARRLRETVSSLSQEERPNWELALSEPWSWGFTLQNYEKANVCCLSHLAYGILLWKVEQLQRRRDFQGLFRER